MKNTLSVTIGIFAVVAVFGIAAGAATAASIKPAKPAFGNSLNAKVDCKPGWTLTFVPGVGRPRCVKDK
jgi:hypothetical protein